MDTKQRIIAFLKDAKFSKTNNLKEFCSKVDFKYDLLTNYINAIRKNDPHSEIIELYDALQPTTVEEIDNDERSEIKQIRDENGKIKGYSFTIFKKKKTPIMGTFNREEMNQLYSLYSFYGDNLQQRVVSRYFPDYSLVDVKRILRAFNITKASSPFAPHMYEEHTEDELKEILGRLKENNFLKRLEKDQIKDLQDQNLKLAKENQQLKNTTLSDLKFNIDYNNFPTFTPKTPIQSNSILMLHLSDLHIGATLETGSLYENTWDYEHICFCLNNLLNKIVELGNFDIIYINMLGDNLDGMDEQTARRDHLMPQNMDNKAQVETFLKCMLYFLSALRKHTNNIIIHSVPEGNHDGSFGYAATLALKAAAESTVKDLDFTISNQFLSHYSVLGETFIICHGKDPKFMKKPMPLYLNDKTKNWLNDYINAEGLDKTPNGHLHVVKGDLHSNTMSSCLKFTYRNVLSLFGDSDYSQLNYSRNASGVSYELFTNGNMTSGTFENLK